MRLGKVLHLSRTGKLITRVEDERALKLGAKVFDERLRDIGRIVDILGSTTAPYVAVKTSISDSTNYIARWLYIKK